MDREHVFMAYLVAAAAIVVWALWPRRSRRIVVSSIPPIRTKVNGFSRHDFWRDVTLDKFTQSCPENAFELLDIDADLTTYVIAVVTVVNWIGPAEFETRFDTTSGDVITKRWSPGKGRLVGDARGLFVLPETVIGGTTEVRNVA